MRIQDSDNGNDGGMISHLLASGEILASQVPAASTWSPEKKLAAAVLTSALVSIRDHHGDPAHARDLEEDLAWIASDDTSGPFGFLHLCDVFGLEPAWVRETVERWQTVERERRTPFSMHRHAA